MKERISPLFSELFLPSLFPLYSSTFRYIIKQVVEQMNVDTRIVDDCIYKLPYLKNTHRFSQPYLRKTNFYYMIQTYSAFYGINQQKETKGHPQNKYLDYKPIFINSANVSISIHQISIQQPYICAADMLTYL